MINRHWVETDGVYELHFEKFGRDEVILKFVQAEDDDTCFGMCQMTLMSPRAIMNILILLKKQKKNLNISMSLI